jgi:L-ascorbate metabolism protein UlaG (beta-lactamase superfamily)
VNGAGPRPGGPTRITWLGHATALIELAGARLVTDPVLRPHVGPLRRHPELPDPELTQAPDAALVSHLHRDHLDLPSLRSLNAACLVAPVGAARVLPRSIAGRLVELRPGEHVELAGLTIEATPAEHDSRRGPFGARAQPIGFVVRGERSVYFAGDTDVFPEMAELAPLDVALLPVAGWGPKLGSGHMNAERAARAAALMHPALAIPIHWGTLHPRWRRRGDWFERSPREFAERVAELAPDVAVQILPPGEWVET